MLRRSLLMLLPLLALPGRLLAQDPAPRPGSGRPRRASSDAPASPKARSRNLEDDTQPAPADAGPEALPADQVPAGFPTNQAGFQWQTFSIADYTAKEPNGSPQTAIVDWIFRRTSPAPWHGDKIAVLCASRTQLRAYNSTKVLKQVAETVDRFVNPAVNDVLTIRVRFVAASDPRWRLAVHQRLTPVGGGTQGQKVWYTSVGEAEMVIAQMQFYPGSEIIGDRVADALNGQTLKFSRTFEKPYNGSVAREGAVGQGYQPQVEKLEEGVVLRFSPLLSYEGDSLDAAIELSTNLVRKLHPVKVLVPREVGPAEVNIEVPEVSETRLNQTVKGWPLGQALIISAGIQPGILINKGGLFNLKLPGTVPTSTELLVIINAEVAAKKGR